jgi:hypothetical protein
MLALKKSSRYSSGVVSLRRGPELAEKGGVDGAGISHV